MDWALFCCELDVILEGERIDRDLFLSLVTSLIIFNCQSMISDAISSLFSHDYLHSLMILLDSWLSVIALGAALRFPVFSCVSIV